MDTPMSRRAILIGGLATAFTITSIGTTGLIASAVDRKKNVTIDVMGDYVLSNTQTGCRVSVRVRNGIRTITSNGLPNTPPGTFPNPGCPNTISAQSYRFEFPVVAKRTGTFATYALPQPFGIGVDGVLFDPLANEWWNNDRQSGWQYYALGGGVRLGLDTSHAHVQPTGAYHYHGIPTGLLASLDSTRHSPLVGWAGDGFPIYVRYGFADAKKASGAVTPMRSSYRLKQGTRPSGPGGEYNGWFNQDYEYVAGLGDLDEANGRLCRTPEYPRGTYAYFLTEEFPSIPNAFAGTIATSFVKVGGPASGQPGGGPGRPGPPPGPLGSPPPRA